MEDQNSGAADALDVQRTLGGDGEAYANLAQRHFGRITSIAIAWLRDRDAAEELAQEVLIRAYLRLKDLRQPQQFPAWCARITRNLAADWLKSRRRSSAVLMMISLEDICMETLQDGQASPRDQVEEREKARILREAILQLPVELREVVLLHFAEGLSKAEIARTLGLNRSSVGRQLDRALSCLRGVLDPDFGNATAPLRARPQSGQRALIAVSAVAAMGHDARKALAASIARLGGPETAWKGFGGPAHFVKFTGIPARALIIGVLSITGIALLSTHQFSGRDSQKHDGQHAGVSMSTRVTRLPAAAPTNALQTGMAGPSPRADLRQETTAASKESTPARASGIVRVSGRVSSQDDAPLPDAKVQALGIKLDANPEAFFLELCGIPPQNQESGIIPLATATSRNDGTYQLQFSKTTADGYVLMVSLANYTTELKEIRELEKADANPRLSHDGIVQDIALKEASSKLDGTVVDDRGNPVANATILVVREAFAVPVATRTANDGRFVLKNLPAGQVDIVAVADNFAELQTTATAPASDMMLRLDPAGAEVSGRVLSLEDGTPIPNARVTLRMNSIQRFLADEARTDLTDQTGAFLIERLAPGNYRILAEAGPLRPVSPGNGIPLSVSIAEHETTRIADILLYPGHTISGTITEWPTGNPIPQAEVVCSVDNKKRSVFTGADGTFRVENVFNDAWWLEVRKSGFKLGPYDEGKCPQVQLTPDKTTAEYNVHMRRALTVSGRVLNSTGGPIEGAEVVLGNAIAVNVSRTTTDATGAYSLEASPDSSFQLSVHIQGRQPVFTYHKIAGESLTDVNIVAE